ncbi:hypothetical protein PVAND_004778 [Polypedilum vanderplanki]|uniref:Uncharacterized protein n=1 Tax=Polypedilum vanderplanki TaxID=319348 RepID=A0A9J6BXZ1_POLVA|nr:hypothetical protein PVAND_004778 [Polypedilum vanderplanki]
MQAALMLRSKQRIARNKLRRQRLGGRNEIPCNVAPPCLEIPPFPKYRPSQEEFSVRRSQSFITMARMVHHSYAKLTTPPQELPNSAGVITVNRPFVIIATADSKKSTGTEVCCQCPTGAQ